MTEPKPVGVQWDHPARGVIRIKDAEKALIEEYMPDGYTRRKKIAIVGYAESSRMCAPFDDPEWSIWGLNQLYRMIPRADRWFETHVNWHEHVVDGTDHVGWLKTCPIPVYMVEQHPEFPCSVRYPIERMIGEFGDYFQSTPAYAIALAINEIDLDILPQNLSLKDARKAYADYRIALFGIDLIVGSEYEYQKPNMEWFIGQALGRGITVQLTPSTALCKQHFRYGYEIEGDRVGLLKLTEIETRSQKLVESMNALRIQLANHDGAFQNNEYWRQLLNLRMRGMAAPST